ncbi:hypothetical protein F0U59_26800 [Archangium gephyra]|nr:hypothetical protein F0U59_26800 [Archangium gephyra]
MVDRALREALELVQRLRSEHSVALVDLERASLWLAALPDSPEWFEHWVEASSNVARLRRQLDRAREALRGHRVRAVLRRREPPSPPPPPAQPPVQLGLFDRPQRRSARARRREPSPEASGTTAGEAVHELPHREELPAGCSRCGTPGMFRPCVAATLCPACHLAVCRVSGQGGDCLTVLPAAPEPPPDAGEQLPATAVELPPVEAVHEQPPEANVVDEVLEQLPEADVVDVEELAAAWCELCEQTRAGTQWNERRGLRLCPGHWPAEDFRVARRAA